MFQPLLLEFDENAPVNLLALNFVLVNMAHDKMINNYFQSTLNMEQQREDDHDFSSPSRR